MLKNEQVVIITKSQNQIASKYHDVQARRDRGRETAVAFHGAGHCRHHHGGWGVSKSDFRPPHISTLKASHNKTEANNLQLILMPWLLLSGKV